MATLENVKVLIEQFYAQTQAEWYKNLLGYVPAVLEVNSLGETSGYRPERNFILISLAKGNLDDHDILDRDGWPLWKAELVHEMLHEFAHKALRAASECGTTLNAMPKHPVWGSCPGHDELFCTAVCEKASSFGLSPEELLGRL